MQLGQASRAKRSDSGSTRAPRFIDSESALKYLERKHPIDLIATAAQAVELAFSVSQAWTPFVRCVRSLESVEEYLASSDFRTLGQIGGKGPFDLVATGRDAAALLRTELQRGLSSANFKHARDAAAAVLREFSEAGISSRMLSGFDRLSCALVLHVMPSLAPLQMEALIICAGIREPDAEFCVPHSQRRVNWRTAIRKAKRRVLPRLDGKPAGPPRRSRHLKVVGSRR